MSQLRAAYKELGTETNAYFEQAQEISLEVTYGWDETTLYEKTYCIIQMNQITSTYSNFFYQWLLRNWQWKPLIEKFFATPKPALKSKQASQVESFHITQNEIYDKNLFAFFMKCTDIANSEFAMPYALRQMIDLKHVTDDCVNCIDNANFRSGSWFENMISAQENGGLQLSGAATEVKNKPKTSNKLG